MSATSIQWTDATWNPTRGCSRVSEGCRNCYAEKIAARFSTHSNQNGDEPGGVFAGFAEMKNGRPHWTGRVELIPEKLDEPLRWKKPRRVFVNSMSDLFHEKLSHEDVARAFLVMAMADRHTFQVLTKRPDQMRKFFGDEPEGLYSYLREHNGDLHATATGYRWPLPNVWLGVSVENQATADERIPLLLQTPAAVRFVSYEPALGPVDFEDSWMEHYGSGPPGNPLDRGLDWLIVGGESGPRARPFEIEWAQSARRQCVAAGVAFFMKQVGTNPRGLEEVADFHDGQGVTRGISRGKGDVPEEWPEDLRVREFPVSREQEVPMR